MKKLAEERRQQKKEDRMARQKVKEQIARDREERVMCGNPPSLVAAQPPPQPTVKVNKDYATCRLQVVIIILSETTLTFTSTDQID